MNNACVAYTTCVNSLGCPSGQICDTTRGRCFECVSSGDCTADSSCVANRCQKKCTSDRTCTPLGLLCDAAAGLCVQCLRDADCGNGRNCNAGTCVNQACVPLSTTCSGSSLLTCGSRGEGYTGSVSCAPGVCTTASGSARCGATGAGGTAGAGGVGNGGEAGAGGFGGAGGLASGGAGGAGSGGGGNGGTGGSVSVTKHILLVADASGSMIDVGGTGVAKWTELMNGVNAFTSDPASATVAAAFQVFPQANAPCDGTMYATPLVAMGSLGPGTPTTQAISTEMSGRAPGFTGAIQSDVEGALRGATAFCINHRQSTGQDCSVVFVTDGNPTLCSADTAVLAQITGNAFTASGVQTWVLAMLGADYAQLDEIAHQGGTDCDATGSTYVCNASGGAVAQFLVYVRDHLGN